MDNTKLISIKDLSVTTKDKKILENINVDIYSDDFIAILGPNGAGKTTLIKCILKLCKYTGKINYYNKVKIGYVPQTKTFDKDFPITVLETLTLGSLNNKNLFFSKPDKKVKNKALSLLKQFNLSNYENKLVNTLSGGQLQKTLICRALMSNCNILILDEPTANLDIDSKIETFKLLKNLNKKIAILLISHQINILSTYVKSFICLNKTLHCQQKHLNNDTLKQVYGDHFNLIMHNHN